MKKTFTIAGIAFVMLALSCGISYLEILMFKALDLSIHGTPYVTWISGMIHAYWPLYAVAAVLTVVLSVFCANSIYSDLKA